MISKTNEVDKHAITAVWVNQICRGGFCRHKDNNMRNNAVENLQWVTFPLMMHHFYGWTIDWNGELNREQTDFAKRNPTLFGIPEASGR